MTTQELTEPKIYDVTIIGGGPVGLFGAFYSGLRQMSVLMLDSLPELGGQLATLYPEKYVYDMPGFPRILARDLAAQLIEQATRFDPDIFLGERVLMIQHEADGTMTITTDRATRRTKSVVIATGAGAFAPRHLSTPGVQELEGRGIHYFVKDKSIFADKRLLIVGGGDSALDWAMNLEPLAKSIMLIHRRDVFRAHEESIDWLLNRSHVDVKLWYELKCVQGDTCVKSVVITDNRTKEDTTVEVDAVLLNIGFAADIGPLRNWGLTLKGKKVEVNARMETNLPGVYAAGDCTDHEGKLDLMATGVGEICIAVNNAKQFVDPNAKVFPGHSSSLSL